MVWFGSGVEFSLVCVYLLRWFLYVHLHNGLTYISGWAIQIARNMALFRMFDHMDDHFDSTFALIIRFMSSFVYLTIESIYIFIARTEKPTYAKLYVCGFRAFTVKVSFLACSSKKKKKQEIETYTHTR